MISLDWRWKINEAIDRLKDHYEHIGRKTGYPFLGIVYPLKDEKLLFREWDILCKSVDDEFDFHTIDVLDVTHSVVAGLGIENVVASLENPMPGSNPENELGNMWAAAAAKEVMAHLAELPQTGSQAGGEVKNGRAKKKKKVVVLKKLAALYPAATPRQLMHVLWNSSNTNLSTPVVVFIPGTLIESRVYNFVDKMREFMYRGDIV